jgi:hypothetical protein
VQRPPEAFGRRLLEVAKHSVHATDVGTRMKPDESMRSTPARLVGDEPRVLRGSEPVEHDARLAPVDPGHIGGRVREKDRRCRSDRLTMSPWTIWRSGGSRLPARSEALPEHIGLGRAAGMGDRGPVLLGRFRAPPRSAMHFSHSGRKEWVSGQPLLGNGS